VIARDNEEVTGAALEAALARFERAREASPGFELPLAAIADATVRRWFLAQQPEGERWAAAARRAVEAALQGAPGLAETRLAAARLEVHHGDFRAAALQLDAALEIAPTYAAAHEYLGMLQCDTGRSREGVQHILLAHELDPTLGMGALAVLRHYALQAEHQRFDQLLAQLRRRPSVPRFGLDLFQIRKWMWHGELERARALRLPADDGTSVMSIVEPIHMALDESVPLQAVADALQRAIARTASPRLRTTWRQVSAELLALRQASALALEALVKVETESVLLDADWIERCPLFTLLGREPAFVELRARVRERADRIWRAVPG
jgi:tetratricopeptide (TPR) repeat protein